MRRVFCSLILLSIISGCHRQETDCVYTDSKEENSAGSDLFLRTKLKIFYESAHHKINSLSEAVQYAWGGPNPNCAVDIYDTNHWDDIQKLVSKLVE